MAYHFETKEELFQFIRGNVLTSPEALEYLGITKQALNQLVHNERIKPIKETTRMKLFFKPDLAARRAAD